MGGPQEVGKRLVEHFVNESGPVRGWDDDEIYPFLCKVMHIF